MILKYIINEVVQCLVFLDVMVFYFFKVEGLFFNEVKFNFDFFNWMLVFFLYCDGVLFFGNCVKLLKFKKKFFYF